MVAVLRTDGRETANRKRERRVFKRPVESRPVEIQAHFVLNEKQYEHFEQCMSKAEEPTALMQDAHAKLQDFIKASK